MNRSKAYAAVAIGLAVTLITALLHFGGALQRFEWIAYDYRMQLFRADKPLHRDVAVILIDETSISAAESVVGRWPWPRAVYGQLLEFLQRGGAKAVIFDILFSETESRSAGKPNASDQYLVDSTQATATAYHATQFQVDQPDDLATDLLNRPLPEDFRRRFALHASGFPPQNRNVFSLPFDGLYQAGKGIGVVGIDADADSVYRRSHLFFEYQGAVFPSLGVAPLITAGEQSVQYLGDAVRIGQTQIPLDGHGQYLVNMAGKIEPYSMGGIFASIQKMEEGELENLRVDPRLFEGKIVFVGASATGLEDIKTTSLSSKTPGVFVHASVASNLLSGDFLHPVSMRTDFLIAAGLSLATILFVLASQRIAIQLAIPVALALGYGAFAFWIFSQGWVIGIATPFFAIAIAVLASSAFLVFTEGRDKRRVRAMFSQYVSPAVLAEVLDHYHELRAEVGRREHLSILFSDVRGFTSLSEKLQAEQVVDVLNTHFSVMSEIVFRYNGTLDKFIGDAIMAFWGAPIRVPDHASRAVCAGIEMSRAVQRVNAELAAKGYPSIDIGIGINSGDMVLGNIGSARKLDYTVIGDHVNLGSRLEGLTKQYGCPVIISEFTYRELGGTIPCAVIDLVRVKGKQVPIRIYWPLALPNDPPADIAKAQSMAELSERAFASYLAGQFEQSEALYRQMPENPLRTTFLTRCREYAALAPDQAWDGVYNLTSK